jgi:hypothetical protein
MTEMVTVPHTCLILDLVTGQAVHTKRGIYLMDRSSPDIQEARIISGLVRVDNGEEILQFTILRAPFPFSTTPEPVDSPAPPQEVEEIESNVVSRTLSPPILVKRKEK